MECNKCHKRVAKGWVCCPYCGQIRVCKKETKILLVIPDEHQVVEGDIVSFKIIKREGEPDGGKKTMIFDEVIRCPLCESEAELIDVVDEHHTEVYRCKVFDDHIFYKNKEKEAKKL